MGQTTSSGSRLPADVRRLDITRDSGIKTDREGEGKRERGGERERTANSSSS
jgi:hypothetical protein